MEQMILLCIVKIKYLDIQEAVYSQEMPWTRQRDGIWRYLRISDLCHLTQWETESRKARVPLLPLLWVQTQSNAPPAVSLV